MCVYWEYFLSLATSWVRGHGAVAASPLLGYRIQPGLTVSLRQSSEISSLREKETVEEM